MRKMLFVLAAVAFAALSAVPASAQVAQVSGYVHDANYGYGLAEAKMTLWQKSAGLWQQVVSTTCTDPTGWWNQGCPRWDGWYNISRDKFGNPLSAGKYWLRVTALNRSTYDSVVNLTSGFSQVDIALEMRDQIGWLDTNMSVVQDDRVKLTLSLLNIFDGWYGWVYGNRILHVVFDITADTETGTDVPIAQKDSKLYMDVSSYWVQTYYLDFQADKLAQLKPGSRVCVAPAVEDAQLTSFTVAQPQKACFVKQPSVVQGGVQGGGSSRR